MFVLQVIGIVIFMYGFLSLFQDIYNEVTYKMIFHKMKIVVFAKDLEKNIEQFIVELSNMKKVNSYKQIILIDLEEKDDIENVKNRFYNSDINIDIFTKEDGLEYIDNNILV